VIQSGRLFAKRVNFPYVTVCVLSKFLHACSLRRCKEVIPYCGLDVFFYKRCAKEVLRLWMNGTNVIGPVLCVRHSLFINRFVSESSWWVRCDNSCRLSAWKESVDSYVLSSPRNADKCKNSRSNNKNSKRITLNSGVGTSVGFRGPPRKGRLNLRLCAASHTYCQNSNFAEVSSKPFSSWTQFFLQGIEIVSEEHCGNGYYEQGC